MSFLSRARELEAQLRAFKADLHIHPELSFREYRTTALLKEKLVALGLDIIDLGMETGVVALLRGGLPGKVVALRADIDALPQQEPTGAGASETPGVMHACGHDFHTACLYGAAVLLAERRATLAGDVVFLFQCAEEVTLGAAAMLSHGLWDKLPRKPDCLFGLHNRPELPGGQIAVMEGPVMTGKEHFEITLRGVTGHPGSPHKCVDVIVPGGALVGALQTVVSRNADPLESLVCAVCSISAGTPENFIPDTLLMTGCIRAHSQAVIDRAKERVEALAEGIAAAHNCGVAVRFIPQTPPVVNGTKMTALARRAAERVVGAAQIVAPRPDMGSEDFAYFMGEVPAFFYWVGSGFPGKENACWHSLDFRTDDSALPIGAALLAESAVEGLDGGEAANLAQ